MSKIQAATAPVFAGSCPALSEEVVYDRGLPTGVLVGGHLGHSWEGKHVAIRTSRSRQEPPTLFWCGLLSFRTAPSWGISKDLQGMYFELYDILLDKTRVGRFLEKHKRNLSDEGIEPSLYEYVKQEFAALPDEELQQARTMLDLLESRRASYLQNISVLLAAIVGAAIGSGLVVALSP